jgi:hypothetical protein
MVNNRFWLGILVMVLVFGMTVVGVEAQSNRGGEFTITNIPAKYDGKYAIFWGEDEDGVIELYGGDSFDLLKEIYKPSRISNGKVILPVWISRNGKSVTRYSGNHTVEIEVEIVELDKDGDFETIDEFFFTEYELRGSRREVDNRVRFSNGNATKSYDDRNKD